MRNIQLDAAYVQGVSPKPRQRPYPGLPASGWILHRAGTNVVWWFVWLLATAELFYFVMRGMILFGGSV